MIACCERGLKIEDIETEIKEEPLKERQGPRGRRRQTEEILWNSFQGISSVCLLLLKERGKRDLKKIKNKKTICP